MVFFTCNHCGESVKKPSVEKHYKMRCRKPVFVSCMDCLKDFREDYVEHTKCITEAEKYSGKDYVPKESKNSGQKKQESWLEIVRSILTTKEYEVSPAVRGIFQKLQSYDNVPRKKAKFENFVSNSMRVKKNEAERVWNVLEKALDKLKAAREAEKTSPAKDNKEKEAGSDSRPENTQNQDNGLNSIEEATTKKEKKKNRLQESDKITNDLGETNKESPKKKKKKYPSEELNGINNDPSETHDEPPKKKKKKNKALVSENGDGNALEIPLTNVQTETEAPLSKKEKKSKRKQQENKECDDLGDINPENSESPSQNHRAISIESADNVDTNLAKRKKMNEHSNGMPTTNGDTFKTNDFNWTEIIFKILGKHNDEISLEKLKAKVLKKYKSHHQVDEIPWKVEKTFNKKLRKSGLLVENDIVKINVK